MSHASLSERISTIGRSNRVAFSIVLGLVFCIVGAANAANPPPQEPNLQFDSWPSPSFPGSDALRASTPGFEPSVILQDEPKWQRPAARALTPLAVDAEMRRWLGARLGRRGGPEQRLAKLAGALLDSRAGLREVPFPQPTPTAIEAFRSRSTNCVGFALLFVALAREMGVPALFAVVPQPPGRLQRGDLQVIEDHLAAGAFVDGRLVLYDLGGRIARPTRAARPVSDLTALAVFQSNRGTELLAAGRLREAVARLELAIELDPELAAAWVNLGVAKRRSGDFAGAEEAYRQALELDPRHPGARDNLVSLLHRHGRRDEALTLETKTESVDPLLALSQAAVRLEQGELEEARSLYLQALALSR